MEFHIPVLIVLYAGVLFSFFYLFVLRRREHRDVVFSLDDQVVMSRRLDQMVTVANVLFPNLGPLEQLRALAEKKRSVMIAIRDWTERDADEIRARLLYDRILLTREITRLTIERNESETKINHLKVSAGRK